MNKKGGYHDFRAKVFCLTVLRYFVGGKFAFQKRAGFPKFL